METTEVAALNPSRSKLVPALLGSKPVTNKHLVFGNDKYPQPVQLTALAFKILKKKKRSIKYKIKLKYFKTLLLKYKLSKNRNTYYFH